MTDFCTRNTGELLNARSTRPKPQLLCELEAFKLCFIVSAI